MRMPPPEVDTTFEELLQDLPPETQDLARAFKAFSRARKIKSPAQLLQAVLLYAGLDLSEREVAATLVLSDASLDGLTDQSVRERLQACQPWLQALLPRLLQRTPLPPLPGEWRWRVIDATVMTAPGQKKASFRVHVMLDLISLQVVSLKLTDGRTGETLKHYELAPGDVVLTDRGYCRRSGIGHAVMQGAQIITRYSAHHFPVCDEAGQPLAVATALRHVAPGQTTTLAVTFPTDDGQTHRAWIHAYRLSGPAAEAARRRCRQEGRKGGRQPRQQTLFLAEFVLILTTFPPDQLDAQTVLSLYRCRWQVELLIKRWKSLLHLDAVRTRAGSVLGDVWLHGKLLYALLIERRARRLGGPQWDRLDQFRSATWWRLWKLVQQQVAPLITGVQHWTLSQWPAALKALTERRRKRSLQRIPDHLIAGRHTSPTWEDGACAA